MYDIAEASRTSFGGGTLGIYSYYTMNEFLNNYKYAIRSIGTRLTFDKIKLYVDKGIPIYTSVHTSSGSHARLIIGYNKNTQEIAYSDSWGENYKVYWVPFDKAKSIEMKTSFNFVIEKNS